MKSVFCLWIFALFHVIPLIAEEPAGKVTVALHEERKIETAHTMKLHGKELRYKATAGQIQIKDKEGKVQATFFYVDYIKDGVKDSSKRPITFCFNGGPGSSSVWLHLGMFGPKRIALDDEGRPLLPYRLLENESTLLDETDLVFIDPISTGYSRSTQGSDEKQFHGVQEDVKSVAEFIRLYTTRNDRWVSPKFLAGASYGTTRSVGVAQYLHEQNFMCVDGMIMISTVLNFQTIRFDDGNDLPYLIHLPSYAAAAWYHHKIPHTEYPNLHQLLKESEEFAYGDYASALIKGDKISGKEREEIVRKLSFYTGLSEEYISNSHLRIPSHRFVKALLRDKELSIGRFDCRMIGLDCDAISETIDYDPSFEILLDPFAAVFNHYVFSELNWKEDLEYKILTNVFPWDWGVKGQYLNLSKDLRHVMCLNPKLQLFIANGYFDLATPYFAAEYTVDHFDLDPSIQKNIMLTFYDGGHMMYLQKSNLLQLRKNLSQFYQKVLSD